MVAEFGKAATYFRPSKDYHGPYEISLPCSEWERVEHSWHCHLTERRNGVGKTNGYQLHLYSPHTVLIVYGMLRQKSVADELVALG